MANNSDINSALDQFSSSINELYRQGKEKDKQVNERFKEQNKLFDRKVNPIITVLHDTVARNNKTLLEKLKKTSKAQTSVISGYVEQLKQQVSAGNDNIIKTLTKGNDSIIFEIATIRDSIKMFNESILEHLENKELTYSVSDLTNKIDSIDKSIGNDLYRLRNNLEFISREMSNDDDQFSSNTNSINELSVKVDSLSEKMNDVIKTVESSVDETDKRFDSDWSKLEKRQTKLFNVTNRKLLKETSKVNENTDQEVNKIYLMFREWMENDKIYKKKEKPAAVKKDSPGKMMPTMNADWLSDLLKKLFDSLLAMGALKWLMDQVSKESINKFFKDGLAKMLFKNLVANFKKAVTPTEKAKVKPKTPKQKAAAAKKQAKLEAESAKQKAKLDAELAKKQAKLEAEYQSKKAELDRNHDAKSKKLQEKYDAKKADLDEKFKNDKAKLDSETNKLKDQYKSEQSRLDKNLEAEKTRLDKNLEAEKTRMDKNLEAEKTRMDKNLEAERNRIDRKLQSEAAKVNGESPTAKAKGSASVAEPNVSGGPKIKGAPEPNVTAPKGGGFKNTSLKVLDKIKTEIFSAAKSMISKLTEIITKTPKLLKQLGIATGQTVKDFLSSPKNIWPLVLMAAAFFVDDLLDKCPMLKPLATEFANAMGYKTLGEGLINLLELYFLISGFVATQIFNLAFGVITGVFGSREEVRAAIGSKAEAMDITKNQERFKTVGGVGQFALQAVNWNNIPLAMRGVWDVGMAKKETSDKLDETYKRTMDSVKGFQKVQEEVGIKQLTLKQWEEIFKLPSDKAFERAQTMTGAYSQKQMPMLLQQMMYAREELQNEERNIGTGFWSDKKRKAELRSLVSYTDEKGVYKEAESQKLFDKISKSIDVDATVEPELNEKKVEELKREANASKTPLSMADLSKQPLGRVVNDIKEGQEEAKEVKEKDHEIELKKDEEAIKQAEENSKKLDSTIGLIAKNINATAQVGQTVVDVIRSEFKNFSDTFKSDDRFNSTTSSSIRR